MEKILNYSNSGELDFVWKEAFLLRVPTYCGYVLIREETQAGGTTVRRAEMLQHQAAGG